MVISGINSLYTARNSGVSTTELRWGNHAPNAADAFGNVGQFSTVLAQSVCVCALMAAICSRASAMAVCRAWFDVFGFDLVEAGFFAQVEQDVVAHMVSPE